MLSILHLEEGDRLKKALSPLLNISEQATITFRKDGVSLQPLYPILEEGIVDKVSAMLRLDSSSFNLYCCNESSSIAWVHLSTIGTIVNTTSDQDRITVFANFPEKLLNFTFQDKETLRARHRHSFIADVPNHYVDLNESNYEYDVIIGIPSEEFRGILRIVNEIGDYAVFVQASNVEVSFISISESGAEYEEFVLKKENGECIIWGVEAEEEDPLMILISLTYIDSYIEALEFCDSPTVWMFKSRGGQPQLRDMLICPIGSQLQGSFNFYFFYPDRNHMEA